MDDPVVKEGIYAVACLDVLGQRKKLEEWEGQCGVGIVTPALSACIENTAGTINGFLNLFVKELEEAPLIQTRASDAFVVSTPVKSGNGPLEISRIRIMMFVCCRAIAVSIAVRSPIRGAITVGSGVKLPDLGFYGPPLVELYKLEQQVADYPRILVSPSLFKLIGGYAADPHLDAEAQENAKACLSLVRRDVDGCLALDFMGAGLRAVALAGPSLKVFMTASTMSERLSIAVALPDLLVDLGVEVFG